MLSNQHAIIIRRYDVFIFWSGWMVCRVMTGLPGRRGRPVVSATSCDGARQGAVAGAGLYYSWHSASCLLRYHLKQQPLCTISDPAEVSMALFFCQKYTTALHKIDSFSQKWWAPAGIARKIVRFQDFVTSFWALQNGVGSLCLTDVDMCFELFL